MCFNENTILIKWPVCDHNYCVECTKKMRESSCSIYKPLYDDKIIGISKDEYNKIIRDDELYEKTMETNQFFRLYEIARLDYEELEKCPLCLK